MAEEKKRSRANASAPALRRQNFVEAYLRTWNASEAARQAGYLGDAAQNGWRLLQHPEIQGQIRERLAAMTLQADEVLARIADQARGDMGDFITIGDDGQARLDLAKAERKGVTHLIKRLRQQASGGWDIELYDAQSALALLARHLQLFVDKSETEIKGAVRVEDARQALAQKLAAIAERRREKSDLLDAGAGDSGSSPV